MVNDFGTHDLTVTTSEAEALCFRGIDCFVRWRSDAMSFLNQAIDVDSRFALPKLVKGWMLHGGRDANFTHDIAQITGDLASATTPGNLREDALLEALTAAYSGLGIEAATALDSWLDQHPTDILVHQLIQNELFWMGKADWMREVTERAAPVWTEGTTGYGSFMSLRAFASEEAGQLDEADRFGRTAIEVDPADAWGAHAVAHVLMMRGEMQQGIDWLETLSPNWGHTNQLRHHLWWHVCLFLLETGEFDRILALLWKEIRDPDSALVKAAPAAPIDIQNVASLLTRLELYGVNVSEHWTTLASICADRVRNHGNAFGNVHDMMVLAATGQFERAEEMLRSMRERYQIQPGSVALAYNAAAIPACEAILAHRQQDYPKVLKVLGSVRHDLSLMGASHTQRDVLYHLLVHSAEQAGRDDLRAVFIRDIERIGFCEVPNRAAYRAKR